MKLMLSVEDMDFKDTKEIYILLIDILSTAINYDQEKEDIIATIEEINKYLIPLETKVKLKTSI